MTKILKLLKFLIGWPLSAISLIFVARLIFANSSTLNNLKSINMVFLFIGILLFLIYFFLRSILWNEILKNKGNQLSFLKTTYFWETAEIKRYTPGNIWSFLSRTDLFSKNNISKKDVAVSLFDEIILIILSCFTISSFYITAFLKNSLVTIIFMILNLLIIFVYAMNKKINIKFFPKLPSEQNLKLYAISLLAFFAFGLATYFSAVSVSYLNPKNILEIVSLFVFALLIGYLSIITPMGLGVREGVTTFGLLPFTTLSNAGLISIFTRIIFILSEVIFLAMVFYLEKAKNNLLLPFLQKITANKQVSILLFLTFIYFLYFTTASFLRYDSFYTGRFDLGNMDQAVWNSIHGRIFQITDPNGTNIISRLAFHADFILVLISPLYLVWSDPRMLLLLQTIVICFGALFLYKLSNLILKDKNTSLVLAFVFLLNPALNYSNLYDFHPVTLASTFLLATFYYFIKRNYFLFTLFAILAGLTKEQVWSLISIFGIAIIAREIYLNKFKHIRINIKEILYGIFVFLTSAFVFYFLIWIAIPHIRGSNHFALSYYSDFGATPTHVIANIFLSPLKDFSIILKNGQLTYLLELFLPLGFLPILSFPLLVFAAPDFAINLLSNNPQLHQIYYQYTATITPFLFIAAIYSIKFIKNKFKSLKYLWINLLLISCTLVSAYFMGPLPFNPRPNIAMFNQQLSNRQTIDNFISMIPTKYSIAASNNLGSHLSRRQNIYTIPVGLEKADVVLFLLNDNYAQPSLKDQKQMAEVLKNDKNYVQVFNDGDFIAFEKRVLYTDIKPKPKKGEVSLFPYSITALIDRSYKKSDIKVEKEVSANGNFKSFVISFISDGLKEYALLNIPTTQKPTNGYPVVIVDHGYIQPSLYDTVSSYKSESDYFADNGYLTIKPDYRGNGDSEVKDSALERFAYPIDVLNLIESVSNIPQADDSNIFLWSHSMGGEVTLTVLEVAGKNKNINSHIQGAVFWAPVTDPVKWFSRNHLSALPEARITPYPYTKTFEILGTPDENPKLWRSLSPLNYLQNINVPILLQHGTGDATVPYSWSVDLNSTLKSLNKNINFISYPNDNHNLPLNWSKAISSDSQFYNLLYK